MPKIGGAPISQSIVTPKKVVSAPKVAPVSEPSSPIKSAPPEPAPVLTESESSVVESSVSSASSSDLKVKSSVLKSSGVDVVSDLEASEPVSDLKSSKTKLSEAFKSFKEKVTSIISAPLLTDKGGLSTGGLMGRIFGPEASLKDKMMGLALREHTKKEFSNENTDFLDALMGVSDMEPGAEQDQALTTLYHKYIPNNSECVLNLSYAVRQGLTDLYPVFSAAKEAYDADPSDTNLAALNEARAGMMDKLDSAHSEIIRLVRDSTARFQSESLSSDISAMSDGVFSATKDKSLAKGIYLSEQLDKTTKTFFASNKYTKEKKFTTEKQVKARKTELMSEVKALRYGSSTTDKIKGAFGKFEQKVLTAKQIEHLKGLEDELKQIDQFFSELEGKLETRSKQLEDNIKTFKKFQGYIESPDLMIKLKTGIPLKD